MLVGIIMRLFTIIAINHTAIATILTYNSSIDCLANGEFLFCSFNKDSKYSSFYMCPKNTFWTKQFSIESSSLIGNLICSNCPLNTGNLKIYHWDTECLGLINSGIPVSLVTKSCFSQWDYLRCETNSGVLKDFLMCKENYRWTGCMMDTPNNPHLDCVECPSDMYNPYVYHYNTTCIRKESSHESTNSKSTTSCKNSIPAIQTDFLTTLVTVEFAFFLFY